MANLGKTPVQVIANVVRCGRCDAELPGHAAGASVRARYAGPALAAVSITDGEADDAATIHRCPAEPE